MVRFGRRRRRFGRGARRRPVRPRTLLRKSRRLRKVAFGKIQRKKQRKNKKVKKNVWGYMDATHLDAAYNQTGIFDLGSIAAKCGLGRIEDMDEIFQQVHQIDDLIYAGQTVAGGQLKANRHNLKIQVQGRATYTIANNVQGAGVYAQIYICKPKLDITGFGVGTAGGANPGDIYKSNLNSRSLVDYNDAGQLGIAAGNITNATTIAKPTVAAGDHWTTPFMVPEFTRTYKVVKVHKVFLPPGGNFLFTIKTRLTSLSRNVYERNNTNAGGILLSRKFATMAFIRFHGQPVDDTLTNTLVNYGPSSLNVVIDKKYEFSYGHQPAYFNVRGVDSLGNVTLADGVGFAGIQVKEP